MSDSNGDDVSDVVNLINGLAACQRDVHVEFQVHEDYGPTSATFELTRAVLPALWLDGFDVVKFDGDVEVGNDHGRLDLTVYVERYVHEHDVDLSVRENVTALWKQVQATIANCEPSSDDGVDGWSLTRVVVLGSAGSA